MKPKNTDDAALRQAQRRKNAILGAVAASICSALSALVLLWLRGSLTPGGVAEKVFLILVVLDLGSILPIWISLKTRLKEIQGGEEDAAAQY